MFRALAVMTSVLVWSQAPHTANKKRDDCIIRCGRLATECVEPCGHRPRADTDEAIHFDGGCLTTCFDAYKQCATKC